MTYLLVQNSRDYADEFDTYGFFLIPKKDWEESCAKLEAAGSDVWNQEYYFGTNECHQWDSYKDYITNHVITEITKEDYNTLIRCFGTNQNGTIFSPTDILKYYKVYSED